MDSGYYAACAGLAAQEQALELAANNLANLNAAGYRADNRPPSAPSWRGDGSFHTDANGNLVSQDGDPVQPSIPHTDHPQAGPVDRGPKAAREFEAQLIGSLLESMEKTLAALPGEDSSSESDNYSFLATHALSQAIAEPGGFGIAAMIAPHLTEAPLKAARK